MASLNSEQAPVGLQELLKPWTNHCQFFDVKWGRVPAETEGNTRDGLRFTVDISFARLNHVDKLRETIELLHLLVVADPECFVNVATEHGITHSIEEEVAAVRRGVPTVLRFRLDCFLVEEFLRHCSAARSLFLPLSDQHDDDFVAVRALLVGRIHNKQNRYLLVRPTHIFLDIATWSAGKLDTFSTEDFFTALTRFATTSVQIQQERLVYPDWEYLPHAPPQLDKICLALHGMHITGGMIEQALAFFETGASIDVSEVTLDPRLIYCTCDDLVRYLQALADHSEKLWIGLGPDRGCDETNDPIDEDRRDRTLVLARLIDAVARVQAIHTLDVGGLFRLATLPLNLEFLAEELIPSILGRLTPIACMSIDQETPDVDTELIAQSLDDWRQRNPGRMLHATRIRLTGRSLGVEGFAAVLTRMNDARAVMLETLHSDARLQVDTFRAILRFPSLTKLSISGATIVSMDLFDPWVRDPAIPSKPSLTKLELRDFWLQDASSMVRFLQRLHDPVHPLSKSLRTLTLYVSTHDGQSWECDEACARELCVVLESNKTLTTVHISLARTAQTEQPFSSMLKEIAARPTHGLEDKGARYSDRNRARNAAFLSVIQSEIPSAAQQLDAFLFRRIYDFSAPAQDRSVRIHA